MDELLERVVIDDTLAMAQRFSVLYCPHCKVGLEHKHKKDMNRHGVWVADGQTIFPDASIQGDRIRSRTASFWLGGVAAAYQSWESLVERYLQAVKTFAMTGEERPLKATTNVDQAMPYLPMAARAETNPTDMQDRAEDWEMGTVPLGVRFLIATVDVQGNRFVIKVMGWGIGQTGALERWVVDWFTLRTSRRPDGSGNYLGLEPATYLEDWDRLIDKVIQRRYPLSDGTGRTMPVRAVGIDWNGKAGTAPRALEFWRGLKAKRLHWRVRLVKGDKARNAPAFRETFPDSTKRKDRHSGSAGDVPQLLLNVNRLKDTLSANTARTEPGPGYYHFPRWLPTSYFDELTAETRTANGWENIGKHRNEAFDLGGYNEALALWLKVPAINWQNPPPWAASWDHNPDVIVGEIAPPPKPRVTRRRVARSKYLGR
jgi:phage terminase large subunit GpA-like protein